MLSILKEIRETITPFTEPLEESEMFLEYMKLSSKVGEIHTDIKETNKSEIRQQLIELSAQAIALIGLLDGEFETTEEKE